MTDTPDLTELLGRLTDLLDRDSRVQVETVDTATFVYTDSYSGKWVRFTNASGCAITLPVAALAGENFTGKQAGGPVTLQHSDATAVTSLNGYATSGGLGAVFSAVVDVDHVWTLTGGLKT